jgi:WS/DGAT/MGAT family acyltransferase
MQQLSGQDASFLYFETANAPMHIGSFALYDPSTAGGPLSYEKIVHNTAQRLHRARCFRQRVVRVPLDLDHPYWIEDPDFDLEFHVRHIALPKPGDWQQLCTQVARLQARPLDLTRPLWELYLIEGLESISGLPPGSFALLTKIHHAAIDGVSGAELAAPIRPRTRRGLRRPSAVGARQCRARASCCCARSATVRSGRSSSGACCSGRAGRGACARDPQASVEPSACRTVSARSRPPQHRRRRDRPRRGAGIKKSIAGHRQRRDPHHRGRWAASYSPRAELPSSRWSAWRRSRRARTRKRAPRAVACR